MSFKHLHAIIAITVGCILLGCRSQIDLNNVDTSMELPLKLSIPVGSFSMKLSDFLGTSDTSMIYIDTVAGKNRLTLKFTAAAQQPVKFTDFNFANNIPNQEFDIDLQARLADVTYDTPFGPVHLLPPGKDTIEFPAGLGIDEIKDTIWFDMPLALQGINNPKENNPLRVDSAQLPIANFDVTVTKKDFDDLQWEWIDKITMHLGPQFDLRGQSNDLVLFERGVSPIYDFGQTMDMDLANIALQLMKNPNGPVSKNNTYDTLQVRTSVCYHIPAGTKAGVKSKAGIHCQFDVDSLKIAAVWGWFTPTTGMSTTDSVQLDFGDLAFLESATLPFAEPSIEATVRTKIAGNMKLSASLFSIDANGDNHPATFDGQSTYNHTYTEEDGCISPSTSSFNDTAKITLRFDQTPALGHIDDLFVKMPKTLVYHFGFNFDQATTPQIRILPEDVYVDFSAEARAPFTFNKGTKFDYSDRIDTVNIAQYQIDSLLAESKVIDSVRINEVWVYLTVDNRIPLNIYATFRCLNEHGDTIMDPTDPSRPYALFPESDTVRLAGATYEGTTRKVVPARSVVSGRVTQQHLNLFPEIKSIVYTIGVDDKSLSESQYGAELTGSNNLTIGLGLTADLKAVVDFMNSNKNKQ